jgi:hypothetical protein
LLIGLSVLIFPYYIVGGGWSWRNYDKETVVILEKASKTSPAVTWTYGKHDLTFQALTLASNILLWLVFWTSGKVVGFRVPQYVHMYGWIT